MSTIQVKPHPDLAAAAQPLIKHPVSGGLLDAAGKVPDDGRPWLYDGFTCRMLADGAILRADDPAFAKAAAADAADAPPAKTDAPPPAPPKTDPSKTDPAKPGAPATPPAS